MVLGPEFLFKLSYLPFPLIFAIVFFFITKYTCPRNYATVMSWLSGRFGFWEIGRIKVSLFTS